MSMKENQPITVLQLCEHFGSDGTSLHGVARSFQWWLPRFDPERFRVLICSRRGYDKAAEQMIQNGIQPLYLGYGKFDIRNLFKLNKIIKREKVELIQAHGYGACLWGHLASSKFKIPLIVHARCNYRTVPPYQRIIERIFGPNLTRNLPEESSVDSKWSDNDLSQIRITWDIKRTLRRSMVSIITPIKGPTTNHGIERDPKRVPTITGFLVRSKAR